MHQLIIVIIIPTIIRITFIDRAIIDSIYLNHILLNINKLSNINIEIIVFKENKTTHFTITLQVSIFAIGNHSFLSNAYLYFFRNLDSDTRV